MSVLNLLSEAGRSFLRAFGAAFVTFAVGILGAPDLNHAKALALAGLLAAIVAGFKAVQVFVPQLSFKSLFKGKLAPYYVYADSFARAFLAALIVSLEGFLSLPAESWTKAAAIALVVGAVTAGIRAVQGALTPGEPPFPSKSFTLPQFRTVPKTP